ncbi:MAG: FHA domain-containing protein, partial [Mycobacteriaceae bacterium]|nr:FHA domain-containing protein [Mycobacteriaceae bacterium]
VLTVRSDRWHREFAAGPDVVVGSDLRADLRVAHPLISRAHLLLRFDQGRRLAIDNNSPSGIFVNGKRVPGLDIRDGQTINLGQPDGPRSQTCSHPAGRRNPICGRPRRRPGTTLCPRPKRARCASRTSQRRPRQRPPASAEPPTTTSSSPTCWHRATTRSCPPARPVSRPAT